MPAALTYPGVYIEEVPSEVRTITGVATSVTAFIGRTARGPVDTPVEIGGLGDFDRIFGGLWRKSALGFAVQDFFRNGGGRAIIVRVFHEDPEAESSAKLRLAGANGEGLVLEAASGGEWGNELRARVDHDVSADVETNTGLTGKLFNLTIRDMEEGTTETFRNVTVEPGHSRSLDRILDDRSSLVRVVTATGRPRPSDEGLSEEDLESPPFSIEDDPRSTAVAEADQGSDGGPIEGQDLIGDEADKKGIYALDKADIFNILCIPPYTGVDTSLTEDAGVDSAVLTAATSYCEDRRAFLIIDPPPDWTDVSKAEAGIKGMERHKNAALYFPRLRQPNPLRNNQIETFAPCGAVAGVFARTDAERGVWKAPAGTGADLRGVPDLSVALTDNENGRLNQLGINCLRARPPAGRVVWGARTLMGDDRLASEWKYVNVRRLALFIEESLYRGTDWVVFEPNDEPLWAQIRLNVGAFMHRLFRQGAFKGSSRQEAYFVKCDAQTTPDIDINLGIVNIVVGFAPLRPAEFVVIKIQQIAGQLEQ